MTFERVATLDDLWDGEMRGCLVGGFPVLLVRLGDDVFAYYDRCAHLGARLSGGTLSEGVVTCPAHLWSYDARTGQGVNPVQTQLLKLPVWIEGGEILVDASIVPERRRP
jgi:toluene monooxygenase system ferredoxin subunit